MLLRRYKQFMVQVVQFFSCPYRLPDTDIILFLNDNKIVVVAPITLSLLSNILIRLLFVVFVIVLLHCFFFLDESLHLSCANCVSSMARYSPDKFYQFNSVALPLVFLAMQGEQGKAYYYTLTFHILLLILSLTSVHVIWSI